MESTFLQARPGAAEKGAYFVNQTVIGPVSAEAKNSGEDHVSYELCRKIKEEHAPADIDNIRD